MDRQGREAGLEDAGSHPLPLPPTPWTEYCQWLLRRRRLFQVVEDSMQPTLQPGDRVLAQMRPSNALQVGEIVVARHPFQAELLLIKRVKERFYDGGCYLISDNAAAVAAQDSRRFGIVGPDLILGRVTSIFWQRP